jgi:hypothetical protein
MKSWLWKVGLFLTFTCATGSTYVVFPKYPTSGLFSPELSALTSWPSVLSEDCFVRLLIRIERQIVWSQACRPQVQR